MAIGHLPMNVIRIPGILLAKPISSNTAFVNFLCLDGSIVSGYCRRSTCCSVGLTEPERNEFGDTVILLLNTTKEQYTLLYSYLNRQHGTKY